MKNLRVLIIVFLINLTCGISFSQVWDNSGGLLAGDEKAFAVTLDKKSNIYVTGYSYSLTGGSNFCTIKYNNSGIQQWVAIYNGQGNSEDKAYAITVDNFANVYVTGYSTGVTSQHDITTIKYNSNGVQQWVRTYNGPGNMDDEAYSIALDEDANVYVAGFVTNSNGNPDMCVIKYNTRGDQKWVKIYHGQENGEDKAYAITIDEDNFVYVTGYSTRNNIDFTTIKYNSRGTQEWVAYFNGSGNGEDKAYAITVDKDGFVYVTGYSSNLNGSTDYATVKYNSSGVQVWVAYYAGPAGTNNKALAIAVDKKGHVYVTGGSDAINNGNSDYATIKYSSTGVQQWVARYNGQANSDDIANSLVLVQEDIQGDNNHGHDYIYVTGQSKEKGPGQLYYHYATLKYNSDGETQWQKIYTAANLEDVSNQVVIDKKGNSYVTGYSFSSGNSCDIATVKYNTSGVQQWVSRYHGTPHGPDSPGKIQNEGENNSLSETTVKGLQSPNSVTLPENFKLYQNYPNPFNPSTTIKFDLPIASYVKVVVYDILGEQVSTLIDGYLNRGQYEVLFHPNNLTSGVYFFEMKTEKNRDIKKMLYIK